jgi:starch synthase
LNILFLTSEAVPFAKTGGLGDVSGILPKVLSASEKVSLMMPGYMTKSIVSLPASQVDGFSLAIGGKTYPTSIKKADIFPELSVFFVSNKEFFEREFLYGDHSGDYPDNFIRFLFFQRAVLEFLVRQGLSFDIIHCNDWQTAMAPLLMRLGSYSSFFRNVKTVFSIHNLGYQGIFPADSFELTGLSAHLFSSDYLEFYGQMNCMKAGIIFSDRLVTVSPTYAKEIVSAEYGFGLDGLLKKYSYKLSGILNGVDYSFWDPRIDPFIGHHYSVHSIDEKGKNKQELLAKLGISQSASLPLLAMISRISEQKGMKLLLEMLPDLLKEELHFVFLGVGDRSWTEKIDGMARHFTGQMTFINRFDERMAHRLEAAADMLLMPSVYEPCGLNQIYSLRYGTVPVVRATGGLEDSVQEFDPKTRRGTGFKFNGNDPDGAMAAIRKSLRYFTEKHIWRDIQKNGMEMDFSWEKVSPEYLDLYKKTLAEETQHG